MSRRNALADPGLEAQPQGTEEASNQHDSDLDASVGLGVVGGWPLSVDVVNVSGLDTNDFQTAGDERLQRWLVIAFEHELGVS
jgi:hypothetical protein